jgi:hypothetical protein
LFSALGLSQTSYNRQASQPVDFGILFQSEYDVLIARYEQTFEQLLFNQLKTASPQLQKQFEAKRSAYQNLRVPAVIPADFNPEAAFREQVQQRWAVDLTAPSSPLDLPEIAAGYERAFIQRAQVRSFALEYLRDFLNKTLEHRSLLLFGRISELIRQLPNPTTPNDSAGTIRDIFTVGEEDIPFENPNDLLTQLITKWTGHDATIYPLHIQALPNQTDSNNNRSGNGHRPPGNGYSQRPETQALVGAIGEGLAFEALRQRDGIQKVEIKSENAAKLGRMPGVKGLGYDLTYVDDQGLHYVEVKSSTIAGNRQFYISQAEVKFGEKHPHNYEILLVTGINEAAGPRYESIGNPFVYAEGEGFLHNTGFTVELDTFKVRFEDVTSAP